jgi:hypothetical protein
MLDNRGFDDFSGKVDAAKVGQQGQEDEPHLAG